MNQIGSKCHLYGTFNHLIILLFSVHMPRLFDMLNYTLIYFPSNTDCQLQLPVFCCFFLVHFFSTIFMLTLRCVTPVCSFQFGIYSRRKDHLSACIRTFNGATLVRMADIKESLTVFIFYLNFCMATVRTLFRLKIARLRLSLHTKQCRLFWLRSETTKIRC